MKAPLLILLAGTAVALTACENGKRAPDPYDPRTQAQRAEECLSKFEPDGKAPQIMTYDSKTGTEVHVNTDGRRVDVAAQNSSDDTALGMGGRVGGNLPEGCTDAIPGQGPVIPASDRRRSGKK